jgi:anti-sigma regulatory factor (Ser/Thr protein kinase)
MERNFTYRAVIQEVALIRKNLLTLKAKWKIPNSEFKQILFIVEEMFSNITRYGYKDGSEHLVELKVMNNSDHIVIEITDDGIPFDPVKYQHAGNTNPAYAEGEGMGLSLIRTFSDDISYRRINQKNHLQVIKRIKSELR